MSLPFVSLRVIWYVQMAVVKITMLCKCTLISWEGVLAYDYEILSNVENAAIYLQRKISTKYSLLV